MPTTALSTPVSSPQTPPTPVDALDLETRMAGRLAQMNVVLEAAALVIDINTAHIPTEPVDLADVITAPVAVPQTPMTPRTTPVADLLQQAHRLLTTTGWCRDAQRDEDGRHCLYGAIRAAAAGNHSAEASALNLVLEAIRREFPGADSVPTFNDAQTSWHVPMRILDQATVVAETRGI